MNTNEIHVILVKAKSTKSSRNDAQGERNAVPRFQRLLTLLGRRIAWMPVLAFIASLSVNIGSATTLVNGANQTGTIFTGTIDSYTFTANKGDNINLRVGTTNFDGWLQLFGTDGKLLVTGTGEGSTDAYINNYTATNSGTFTVNISSWYINGPAHMGCILPRFQRRSLYRQAMKVGRWSMGPMQPELLISEIWIFGRLRPTRGTTLICGWERQILTAGFNCSGRMENCW